LTIFFLLFVASGIIAVPILDKQDHLRVRRDWLVIHQECQCKYANITSLTVTTVVMCPDKSAESVTFANINTTGAIDVERACFIEHPIKIMNSIRYDNPYDRYQFLADNRAPVWLGIWFGCDCALVLMLFLIGFGICAR